MSLTSLSRRHLVAVPVLTLVTTAFVTLASPAAQAVATPRCQGVRATIVGTAKADHLVGTPKRDVIVGLGGRDRIEGRGGNDLVCGGDGADRIDGGAGDDRLFGQRGTVGFDRGGTFLVPNVVLGGPGDDVLDAGLDPRHTNQGGLQGIVSYGTAGRGISLSLGNGVTGTATGAGHDTLRVHKRTLFRGSPYADTMTGGKNRDLMEGGLGDDTLKGLGGNDELSGEPGSLKGPADDDVLYGGAGADRIVEWKGSDVIHGGPGRDLIGSYSARPARVYGDEGNDDVFATVSAKAGFVLDGGPGKDTATFTAVDASPQQGPVGTTVVVHRDPGTVSRGATVFGTLLGAEELVLDDYLRWDYYGTDDADVVTGGYYHRFHAWTYGGDDVITGSGEDDLIDAGDDTDTVEGLEGDDTCLNAEVRTSCEQLTP